MNILLKLATGLLVIIAVLTGSWLVNHSTGEPSPSADEVARPLAQPVTTGATERPSRWVGRAAAAEIPDAMPASLQGTSIPSGWVVVDSTGRLIPTPQLRQLFEYYLSAVGEEPLQTLVARIEQQLDRFAEPARSEALGILGHYLDYKLALGDLEASYGDAASLGPEEMQRRMEEIRALRRTWLDADTAEAFFASEEAIDRFQISRRRIAGDATLSDDEREQALARAEQSLPEPLRRAREDTRRFIAYEQAKQTLADDPGALNAWREERFGAEIAQRLEDVDERQRDWERRWQEYSTARSELDDAGLAGPERKAAIERLRDRHFSGPERLRAEALDTLR
ncbi:MAG: lipase secretion chaperone [Pseudomonadota bacterium]